MTEQRSVTFETTLAASGNNTGIEVPPELVERLGAGRRPPVTVDLGGYAYRSTVAVLGGRYLVGVSAAVRQATGLGAGDPVRVTLTLAETPREVDVPADLAAALAADPAAQQAFATLDGRNRYAVLHRVATAATPQTRARRIAAVVTMLAEGRRPY